jgi:hypothetical protein
MRVITLIIIHCSAVRPDQTSSAAQIDTWHRKRGFHLGIGYPKALIVGHHDLNPQKACPCIENVAREYADLQPK